MVTTVQQVPTSFQQAQVQEEFRIQDPTTFTTDEIKNIFHSLNDSNDKIAIDVHYYIFLGAIIINSSKLVDFTDRINRIIMTAPAFNIKQFLIETIPKLAIIKIEYENYDYARHFFNMLDTEIVNSSEEFKKTVTDKIHKKAMAIAQEFNVPHPEINLLSLMNSIDALNDDDPRTLFPKADIYRIIKSTENSMTSNDNQISGLDGIYKSGIYYERLRIKLGNLGTYNQNTSDMLGNYILQYIAKYYKTQTDKMVNPETIEKKLIDKVNNDESDDKLGILNKLIPGIWNILNPLLNHNDGDKYGHLDIDINKTPDKDRANITVRWIHDNKNAGSHPIVYQVNEIKIKNSGAGLLYASKLFFGYYHYNAILPETIFEIPELADALDINPYELINKLSSSDSHEITLEQLEKLAENASNADSRSDIFRKVKQLTAKIKEIKAKVKDKYPTGANIKIKYSNPNNNNSVIQFKLEIIDGAQVDDPEKRLLELSSDGSNPRSLNTMKYELATTIIKRLIDNYNAQEPSTIPGQYFESYALGKELGNNYFSTQLLGLEIKGYLDRWHSLEYGENISKNTSVQQRMDNNYLVNLTIIDGNFPDQSIFNDTNKTSFQINTLSINDQLKPIRDKLFKFRGKPKSIFDSTIYNPENAINIDKNTLYNALVNIDGTTTVEDVATSLPKGAQLRSSTIKQVDSTYNPFGTIRSGLGLTWTIELEQIDLFNNDLKTNVLVSNDYVYEFSGLTETNIIDAKNDFQEITDQSVKTVRKQLIGNSEIDNQINDLINNISNIFKNSLDELFHKDILSKKMLKWLKLEAIAKITILLNDVGNFIPDTIDIIKKLETILDRSLTHEDTNLVNAYHEVFEKLLEITKNHDFYKGMINNTETIKKFSRYIDSNIFIKVIDGIAKTESKYKYAYFGIGVASGIAGLGAIATSLWSVRAKKKLANMVSKKAKMRGGKLVTTITVFIGISIIAISVITELWFFIVQGGF
ncbi:hypothetical protein [Candidatus Mycoplasma mahonii]|uniref:hypothetical protein n=1 Tax=Candidatus Mycoplasma mahonii TaxID=3004105 RepID=UPI0026EDAD9E|nr:hypothetical protein [Candidatus Mycoplasma mahonii]WKX02184.1 hypothetical protein O3I44_02155 [Candidatus Mycoplasma mahonii]